MLDIEKLISLNRLRDKKIEGIGNYKKVEICRNPDKVLKPHENHEYEIVEVLDNTLHDKSNEGIIDSIVRMTFEDVDYEYQLRKTEFKKTTYGFYLRYRKYNKSETNVHAFNKIFYSAEKTIVSRFSKSDKYFEEDYRSYARLLVFEILCGQNERFNKSFNNTFNLSFNSLDDVKSMLLDYDLANHIKAYINKFIARTVLNNFYNGKNDDVLLTRHRDKNGNENTETKHHNNISLDSSFDKDDDNADLHEVIYGVIEDNQNSLLDSDVELYGEKIEIEKGFEIYKYIFDNIEKIVTKPQLKYFNDCLTCDGYIYDSTTKSKYKKYIQKSIMNFFSDNKSIKNINGKYKFIRNSLADDLLFILDSLDNVQRLDKLVDFLKKDDYKADFIIDMIYDLDLKYRQDLTALLLGKDIDKEKYANGKFIYILNILQKYLLFLEVLNENEIFLFNKVEVDPIKFEIKQYIESNVFKDKEVGLLPTRPIAGYISFQDLHDFMNEKLRYKIPKNKIKKVIKSYGYEISSRKLCSIKGYSSYKVFRC